MDKPSMTPCTGERLLRFVGDHVQFILRGPNGRPLPDGYRALLRTNLGRAAVIQEEIIRSYAGKLPLAGASWRDIPMRHRHGEWTLDLSMAEVGYFKAKAYAVDPEGRQYWPEGADVGVCVHPDQYRTANTIYCAFVRLFGDNKTATSTKNETIEAQFTKFDKQGFTIIPPSGKLRDVLHQLPHIMETLGCRILHLLPVNPTPTTYARFGRFGSPYASQDLTAVDPALVEFDRRTTGIDQFRELAYGVHARGGRVFLDIVTNHTGWGSPLQENHPEWFLRDDRGDFVSPGAWGVTWEDLVELDHRSSAPWDYLADVFVTWCRRGVDGFRCDAGYKVPMPAWRYITARVRQEFPETVFLLEGLGGSWEATENLLTEGGMQWAYSELFQNYTGSQVAHYLDYALNQSHRVGIYVHYSETHDNDRLAKGGRIWSLLRNRLCGLTSAGGGYGITCGVEWLAAEKINVHSSTGLSWGSSENLVAELSQLNRLLSEHPCFSDGAKLTRLSPPDSTIYALRRDSWDGVDRVLVLVNTDSQHAHTFVLEGAAYRELGEPQFDLVGQTKIHARSAHDGRVHLTLGAGACLCLSSTPKARGLAGDAYRRSRSCAAWALKAVSHVLSLEEMGAYSWQVLAEEAARDPKAFLAILPHLKTRAHSKDFIERLLAAAKTNHQSFPQVVTWRLSDLRRVVPIPPDHWLLIEDKTAFRAALQMAGSTPAQHTESISLIGVHVACFAPTAEASDASLIVERYAPEQQHVTGQLRFLSPLPRTPNESVRKPESSLVLLTNQIGGMARLAVDLGRIHSKYDCLLGANLHASVPVDRHVLAKRARVWVNADGFISPLDQQNLFSFEAGPPASWRFVANAGDGRTVEIVLEGDMLEGRNTTVLHFSRPHTPPPIGKKLPDECDVRLTVRVDIEDRTFHWETKRNSGADHHFSSNSQPLRDRVGFEFTPSRDRKLRVYADAGHYHHEGEWCENIPHPIEQSRGQTGSGDAFSPGWFDLPLAKGRAATLVATADVADPSDETVRHFTISRRRHNEQAIRRAKISDDDTFGRELVRAVHAFVVRRVSGKTVIAGYPWFLDWGRDSLICARGLLAAGMHDEVKQLLITFGRFEDKGTLPNSIHGEDASNRDTSDAPLWFGVVCEEAEPLLTESLREITVDNRGRTLAEVLADIAAGYLRSTPNGIRVDAESGLVWSPKHFTWMDTNFPAGTPRVGYPVEIQVLWIRLLRQLQRLEMKTVTEPWKALADRAEQSLLKYFWIEERGYLSDLLIAEHGQKASAAVVDDAMRSNCLFAVSLGLLTGKRAQRCVEAALRYLVIPGALRSLAPLPVSPPLPIHGNNGGLLNDPPNPYWGRYEGDEDTRRKPAYHNGTAWTWTFPTFCEALARAWELETAAVAAAKAYLGSMDRLLNEGCLGHLPEILDGDAPHQQRGCDAQAWGATEALRVWKWLNEFNH